MYFRSDKLYILTNLLQVYTACNKLLYLFFFYFFLCYGRITRPYKITQKHDLLFQYLGTSKYGHFWILLWLDAFLKKRWKRENYTSSFKLFTFDTSINYRVYIDWNEQHPNNKFNFSIKYLPVWWISIKNSKMQTHI